MVDRLASFPVLQCVLLLLVCMHWAPTLAQVINMLMTNRNSNCVKLRCLRNLLVYLASLIPRPLPVLYVVTVYTKSVNNAIKLSSDFSE